MKRAERKKERKKEGKKFQVQALLCLMSIVLSILFALCH
jgi:hypothetical protein